MNKPDEHKMEAIRAINGLHVSWLYFSAEARKKYRLEKKYAFYHTDINVDFILRLEKELQKLHLKNPEDFCIQECSFGDWDMFTICLTDKTSSHLERMGIRIGERL